MSETIVLPRYEPLCQRCGHSPGVHTTTSCANYYQTFDGRRLAVCDCQGWKRDMEWPQAQVIQR